jgi:hypothetical protein
VDAARDDVGGELGEHEPVAFRVLAQQVQRPIGRRAAHLREHADRLVEAGVVP